MGTGPSRWQSRISTIEFLTDRPPVTRRRLVGATAAAAGAVAAACLPTAGGPEPQAAARRNVTLHVIYPPTSDADLQIFTKIFKQFEEQHQGISINYDNAAIGHGDKLS